MKKFNIKAMFVNHAEKMVFGLVCLVVLFVMTRSEWGTYPDPPEKLIQEIQKARAGIDAPDNLWPDEAKFKTVNYSDRAKQLFSSASMSRYHISTPLFYPLNKIDEPRREPVFTPVQELIATAALVTIGVQDHQHEMTPEQPMEVAATETPDQSEDVEFKPRGGATGAATGPAAANAANGPAGLAGMRAPFGGGFSLRGSDRDREDRDRGDGDAGMAMPAHGGPMASGLKTRGVRVVSVRGVFPLKKQIEEYVNALHQSHGDSYRDFEIADFVLERQTALPGPNPWKDAKWIPVRIESAAEVLKEAAEIDREDPVPLNMKDQVITMDLPYRMIGGWDNLATHPRIKDELLKAEELANSTGVQR